MPLTIRASVVDITTDTPKSTDKFLVDTNVWLWLYYEPLTLTEAGGTKQQAITYPSYYSAAQAARSTFYTTGLVYSELAHIIERTQKSIYDSKLAAPLDSKVYRHDYPQQRMKVIQLISEAWKDITTYTHLLDINLNDEYMQKATALFSQVGVDGYDGFTAQLVKQSDMTGILTDDGDFASVGGLTVFTANQYVIKLARTVGKLITR